MNAIPLSALDHIFTGTDSHPIEFAFSYADSIDPGRLQSSLEKTLEHFEPLSSQLARISDDAYGFRLEPGGLSFSTSHSSVSFDDADNFYAFLDPVKTVEGEPLTRIKLTQTPAGSVLGVSISHTLVDGFSYFHFLSSWSRLFRGDPFIPPVHKRELLIPDTSDQREPITPDDLVAKAGVFWCEKRGELAREQIRWESFILSRQRLKELLRQAQKESDTSFSHNDVIVAQLWKKYASEWSDGKGNPANYVSLPVDIRRIPGTLPQTYFGSAVCLTSTSMSYEELAASSLGKAALAIRSATGKVDQSYALGSLKILDALRRQEGLEAMEKIHVMHPETGLLVTNISRLPVGDFDFGTGGPTGYRILTPAQRAAAILPAEDGVEIRICHPPGWTPGGMS
jgi:shikimate O-hydroxycinnamoyltransferase